MKISTVSDNVLGKSARTTHAANANRQTCTTTNRFFERDQFLQSSGSSFEKVTRSGLVCPATPGPFGADAIVPYAVDAFIPRVGGSDSMESKRGSI